MAGIHTIYETIYSITAVSRPPAVQGTAAHLNSKGGPAADPCVMVWRTLQGVLCMNYEVM